MRLAVVLLPVVFCACAGELEVPSSPPVADAGFDQVRHLDTSPFVTVELDGSASCDPAAEGKDIVAAWRLVESPGGADLDIEDADALTASFLASEAGEYLLSLVVTAGDRTSSPDDVLVRVLVGGGSDVVVSPPETDACGNAR